jgi:LmbE family N-acetylglucosaminyl deacetylase
VAQRLWEPVRPFSRALVVVAHPDDAEFGAAGTIARWVAMGTDVRYLVVTDGASGSADPEMTRERLATLREDEQRAACASLGVTAVEFLGHADGYLEPSVPVRREVAAAIRRHRPEVVVTLDPSTRWSPQGYINHPDHRAVGDLVLHSVNPAASTRLWDPSLLDEGLEPWDIAELWLMSFSTGDVLVDITETFDDKIAALREHRTQLNGWDPAPRMREMNGALGAHVDRPLCEGFTVLQMRVLDDTGSDAVRDKPPTNPRPSRD